MHTIFAFLIHYEYFASFHFMKKKVEIGFKMPCLYKTHYIHVPKQTRFQLCLWENEEFIHVFFCHFLHMGVMSRL
jgi:hypothetical protein